MNISNTVTISLSFGLVVLSGAVTAVHAGDESLVRMIEPPKDAGDSFDFYYSGDSSVVIAQGVSAHETQIHINRGDGWVLNRRALGARSPGPWPFDVSSDGGAIGISDLSDVDLVIGQGMFTLPRIWETASGRHALFGQIQGRCVSGDGQSVAFTGWYDGRAEALLWAGGDELVNLSIDRDEPATAFISVGMSHDGLVVAGYAQRLEPLNDIPGTYVNRPWVYIDGSMMDIPELEFEHQVSSEVSAISGDGRVVVGLSNEDWLEQSAWASVSWMWTQENGTVEIGDSDRFEGVAVKDVSYDGTVMFGEALVHGEAIPQKFLWYPESGFVLIDELLVRKGIHIDADDYEFYELSDDGSKLMGAAHVDGHSVGLIVTLPEHGDVLTETRRDRTLRSLLGR